MCVVQHTTNTNKHSFLCRKCALFLFAQNAVAWFKTFCLEGSFNMIFMDSVAFPGQEGSPGGQFTDVAKLSPSFSSHTSVLRVTQAFQTTPVPMQQRSACCFCFFLWHRGGSKDRNRGWELAIGFQSAKGQLTRQKL